MKKIQNIEDVSSNHLCTGCGACAGLFPSAVRMVETTEHARRPQILSAAARQGPLADNMLKVCPGAEIEYRKKAACSGTDETLFDDWGPVLEVWEGHAADPDLRFRGSSGGLVSALALYCIEHGDMGGVLHVKANKKVPYLNESAISTNRNELLEGAGSRYAPASPCDRLDDVEKADQPLVFIGKPCDVAAATRAARTRPQLQKNLGLTIGIFCAGVPSLEGTFDLMRALGAKDSDRIDDLRYRGHGWPGNMQVTVSGPDGEQRSGAMSYSRGWGEVLQKKRQWRCHVCADHTGELADLSVGDPWYRVPESDEPGKSLLVVRSERGRRVLRAAMAAGYVVVERRKSAALSGSQPNLLRVRGSVWGRTLTLRLMGAAYPVYSNLNLLGVWRKRLNWREKAQSFYGTVRRVLQKRLTVSEIWTPMRFKASGEPLIKLGTPR